MLQQPIRPRRTQESDAWLRQKLNKPPGEDRVDPEDLMDMSEAGKRSAKESGLPPPVRHPGDEERESGLA